MKRFFSSLLLLLLLAVFCGCVSGAQIQSYNEGVAAFDSKDFENAKLLFLSAGNYGNSRSYLSAIEEYEKIYLQALDQFESRNYAAARNSFDSIADFGNSSEYVAFIDRLRARYEEGVAAFEEQDYVTARNRFIQSMGYLDAQEIVRRISRFEDHYRLAMGYYMEGDYDAALASFRKIGAPYKDSEEKIASIYDYFSKKGVTPALYRTLFNQSCEDEAEPYSLPIAEPGKTGFAWRTTNGLMMIGNTNDEGYISTLSFWMERSLQKELGDSADRLFAHCIHALTGDGEPFDKVLADIELYYEGSRSYGGFELLLEEDDSGAIVLTADFVGNW